MFFYPITYHKPLFRPPAEGGSVIFQATLGCSYNRCAFCEMYKQKKFVVRKECEVISEIKKMAPFASRANKFFLADGNAFVLSAGKLLRICEAIHQSFRRVRRISAYALPGDIASKSHEELVALRQAGLSLLYVGIESGDDELLSLCQKGETFESTRVGLLKAREAGIKLSVMILNGLGGKVYSKQHAINSARLVNEIQPEYLSLLVLNMPFGEAHYANQFKGLYQPQSLREMAVEMADFIAGLRLQESIFRSDHVSNFLVLKGILNRDQSSLLKQLHDFIEHAGDESYQGRELL